MSFTLKSVSIIHRARLGNDFSSNVTSYHNYFLFFQIKHCIAISKGDIDSATQILLHRQETNQSLTDKSHTLVIKKNVVVDDNELKNRIIAR